MHKIIVFSVPRSGSSWLGAILGRHAKVKYRFQPIHSYTFRKSISAQSSLEEIDEFFFELWGSGDPYVRRESLATNVDDNVAPESVAETHLVFKEVHDFPAIANCVERDKSVSLIGLVRDPVDVIKSWVHSPREWSSKWRIEDEWFSASKKNREYRGNHFGVMHWLETTQGLLRLSEEHPTRIRIQTYAELKADTNPAISRILSFSGLENDPNIERFLRDSRAGMDEDPYSVMRGNVPDYHDSSLPVTIADAIRDLVRREGLGDFLRSS